MYFKYGNYTHNSGEVDLVNFTMRRMYSQRNRLAFKRRTMSLLGHFCISGQDDIKDEIQGLEAAYKDGADAYLYHDDGTKSAHGLPNSSSINGVRVLSIAYPKGSGGEYATGRTYQIQMQADYLEGTEDLIYAFRETITQKSTGGPKWELVPAFNAPPELNPIFAQTPQLIVQSGEAIGLTGWPDPGLIPGPILPGWEHLDRRTVTNESPRVIGRYLNMQYKTTWQYEFSVPTVGGSWYPNIDWR